MRARPGAAAPGDPRRVVATGCARSRRGNGVAPVGRDQPGGPIRFGPVVITISDARTGATSRRRAAVDALPVAEVPDTAGEYLV